jgi:carbamoyltransferase
VTYNILGLNDPWHDSSLCFLSPNDLRHFEMERFTRHKYEKMNPILGLCELFPNEISHITHIAVEYGEFVFPLVNDLLRDDSEAAERRFVDQLLEQNIGSITYDARISESVMRFARLVRSLGEQVRVYDHHLCHAANAFHSSDFTRALVFTMDGGGYDQTPEGRATAHFSAWKYDIQAEPLSQHLYTEYERSVGLAWWRGTEAAGLTWGSEGTLMAMSALGRRHSTFRRIVQQHAFWYPMLHEISNMEMVSEAKELLSELSAALNSQQDVFDFAFELQAETERVIKKTLEPFLAGHEGDVCLSGGAFMNCVAVGKLKSWFPEIKNVYLPPAPYDGGICIGAAQILETEIAGASASSSQTNRSICNFSLGINYTLLEVVSAIRTFRQKPEDCTIEQVAKDLAEGQIVAIFQGSAESGRRALGNRSILADPRRQDLKDFLNDKVKHRQWFRPFAPMVLADAVQSWFDVDEYFTSPYMSFAQTALPGKAMEIPGVLHQDQSARVQTIDQALNPVMYGLISAFAEFSGVPILLNTSFNDREPIVENPSEAMSTFMRTPIDQLFFADFNLRVRKSAQ